eukprot:UN18544
MVILVRDNASSRTALFPTPQLEERGHAHGDGYKYNAHDNRQHPLIRRVSCQRF